MNTLIWILLSTFIVSALSLIGIISLLLKEKVLNRIIFYFVALSAGALMGSAFLHLLHEAIEKAEEAAIESTTAAASAAESLAGVGAVETHGHGSVLIFVYFLLGFALFFFIEKVLHWRHCHEGKCDVHTFAYMNLVGDSVHNFIDGVIIAASFIADFRLGIITSLAIALHEIPQEIGDFAVSIYGGLSKAKALALNFITALTAVLGGILGYYFSTFAGFSLVFLLPFAAGGFIYIAASDLIPEIRKEMNFRKYLLSFGVFLFGILLMYVMGFVGH